MISWIEACDLKREQIVALWLQKIKRYFMKKWRFNSSKMLKGRWRSKPIMKIQLRMHQIQKKGKNTNHFEIVNLASAPPDLG